MPNSIKKTNVIDKVIEVLANIGNIAKKHETTNCVTCIITVCGFILQLL